MEDAVNKATFARLMQVHPAQVTRWTQMGMPMRGDGRVDAGVAFDWVERNIDPAVREDRSLGARRRRLADLADDENPIDQALRLGIWLTARQVPALAAEMAVASGVPVALAHALHRELLVQAAALALVTTDLCGIRPGHESEWPQILVEIRPPDWQKLAASAGERYDPEAWLLRLRAQPRQ